jgi:hypothetical protein
MKEFKLYLNTGRAIAQAVSRRLLTAGARVRARVRSCWICGGQSDGGADFLRVLRLPLPIDIPLIAPQSPSSITWCWYNRPNGGRSTKWTQSHTMRENRNIIYLNTLKTKFILNNVSKIQFVPHRKYYASATKSSRLMMYA